MAEISKDNFFFLNRDGRWPGFKRSGLELRRDGVLQLSSLPRPTGSIPDAVKLAATPDGPAGLAMDAGGTLFFSDPDTNSVRRILGCDGTVGPVPCIGSAGVGPTSFNTPRGLLISSTRSSLFVVDSGNHCIKIFDLGTFQLVEIWGQPSLNGTPQPGSNPGEFNTPWTLAGDPSGNVYVIDYGNQRVQKFNALGEVVPRFCDNVQASGSLQEPVDIAVHEQDGDDWILVADRPSATIYVFDRDGRPVHDSAGNPRLIRDGHLTQSMGLATAGNSVYVGDNASRCILRFQIDDTFKYVGAALGYQGPVAALLLDGESGLWVHSGSALTPNKLATRAGHVGAGSLWLDPAKPLRVGDRKVQWHRLQALAKTLRLNAHLDLFAYASSDLSDHPVVYPSTPNPFSDPKWQSIPYTASLNVTDLYIGRSKDSCDPKENDCGKSKYLWVGALFSGDGTVTPEVWQLRVEFDYPTYDRYLPAVYRNHANCGEFLARLLSLFESFFSGMECEIDALPALFDPRATPKGFLAWLAGCLGLELDDNWDEDKKRQIIARIFELSGRRRTAAGLREILRLFAGVDATIEEPLLHAAWWSLPSPESCCEECASNSGTSQNFQQTQNSRLGWTTMLASAQPQGAVVGTSAVLDQSHLISNEDFGAPLFNSVAHQFSVQVYRSQLMCPDAPAKVRTIINQEKPAHTAYHLCIIDPRFRVGFQSRIGIDTVVAGPPRSLALGSDQGLGFDSTLAGPPPSLLGTESRLGVTTHLG
jgi:phage tail-like protein